MIRPKKHWRDGHYSRCISFLSYPPEIKSEFACGNLIIFLVPRASSIPECVGKPALSLSNPGNSLPLALLFKFFCIEYMNVSVLAPYYDIDNFSRKCYYCIYRVKGNWGHIGLHTSSELSGSNYDDIFQIILNIYGRSEFLEDIHDFTDG